jgi:hypothetical protein
MANTAPWRDDPRYDEHQRQLAEEMEDRAADEAERADREGAHTPAPRPPAIDPELHDLAPVTRATDTPPVGEHDDVEQAEEEAALGEH